MSEVSVRWNVDVDALIERAIASSADMPPRRHVPGLRQGCVWIYFVTHAAGGDEPIKIGSTIDLPRRLSQLQVASPWAIVLLGAFQAPCSLETEMHALAEKLVGPALQGEWFEHHPVLAMLAAKLDKSEIGSGLA